jgi:hypothetical protein
VNPHGAKISIYFFSQRCTFVFVHLKAMDTQDLQQLKSKWEALTSGLADQFGEDPDLQAIIFLIGVQELGRGPQKFSKDEKEDLMHIATCKLLSLYGYYELEGIDQDGWPHWKLVKKMPPLSLKEQDLLLKQAVLQYFEES